VSFGARGDSYPDVEADAGSVASSRLCQFLNMDAAAPAAAVHLQRSPVRCNRVPRMVALAPTGSGDLDNHLARREPASDLGLFVRLQA
jgi:hypothetical protein